MVKNITTTICMIFLLFTAELLQAQDLMYGSLTFNKAVNVSGKQRMLTQRMAKIYLYLLDNPEDFKAQKDLKITKLIFEKQLAILEKNTKSLLTQEKINKVKKTWKKYKAFLDSEPNEADAKRVINTNTTILKFANNVVEAIIVESKGDNHSDDSYLIEEDSELKDIINKAGRQRMLSQRLGLYYYANKKNLKTDATEEKLNGVFEELDNALNDLLISSFNNERIDEALGNVMALWDDVNTNKERLLKQGYKDIEIYKLSNSLTKMFNTVTNLYEKVRVE